MSQELADLQSSEQTQAAITDNGAVETPAVEQRSEPEQPKSLRDQIVSAKKEVEAEAEAKRRGNPYKSADGKFTKKPLENKAPETAATEAKPESEAKPQTEQQPQVVAMPKSWSADKQELWTSLPQAAKDFILSRENQVNEGFAKYQGVKPELYKELDAVLTPLDPMIQQYGTTRPEFVRQLASWHQALASNPNEAFPALARAYGYNLTGSPAADPAQQQPYVVNDPRVDQLTPVVSQLQQKLMEAERREQEAQMRQTSEKVASWAKDKPHFEKVRTDMGLLIKAAAEAGKEMSLDEAYHKATWGNSEIAEQLMKERFEAEQKAAREKAEKAKLASVSVVTRSPAPANGNGADKGSNLRNTIKEAMATVNGAGRA